MYEQNDSKPDAADGLNASEDEQLTEIRLGLSKVRFTEAPPWGIKTLFAAVFRVLDVLETIMARQADFDRRLRAIEFSSVDPNVEWRDPGLNFEEQYGPPAERSIQGEFAATKQGDKGDY